MPWKIKVLIFEKCCSTKEMKNVWCVKFSSRAMYITFEFLIFSLLEQMALNLLWVFCSLALHQNIHTGSFVVAFAQNMMFQKGNHSKKTSQKWI